MSFGSVDSGLGSERLKQFTSQALLSTAHTCCTVASVWLPTRAAVLGT